MGRGGDGERGRGGESLKNFCANRKYSATRKAEGRRQRAEGRRQNLTKF
ncbi:MAG: hypothetical protein F6K36_11335 [Symploca sp. SIO3C6]|nr:hypothetical protein [Symploca sp. SIO3C6]